MIDRRYKVSFYTIFVFVFGLAIGVYGCSKSRSRNVAYSYSDGGDTAADENDSETNNYRSIDQLLSDRVVTPDEISIEVLEAFIEQPGIREESLKSESADSCGYIMTFADVTENQQYYPSKSEIRLFDSAGRLRIRKSDLQETEITYDEKGRPITIWNRMWAYHGEGTYDGEGRAITETWFREGINEAEIIAVEYHEDGSAFSKTISNRGCQKFVFDSNSRLVEHLSYLNCDDDKVSKLEMTYREDGKPLFYSWRYQDYESTEIAWEYVDDGREVVARWDDVDDIDNSTIHFDFDPSDKLISIRVDYKNDGEIDEVTVFEYDEKGNTVRVATDLDRDGIDDLLRLNIYDESGLILTEELHNFGVGGNMVSIGRGDFSEVTTSTARVTRYTYDSESRLIERVIDGSTPFARPGYYVTERANYRYDDFGRFVELQVIEDTHYQKPEEKQSLYESRQTKCRFDYSCDTIPDQTSEPHRCDLSIERYQYLFPFNLVREIPFHNNLLPVDNYGMYSIEPEDVLGIPWY